MMTRLEETQYHVDHVGVLAGAELPEIPTATALCEECGGEVSLDGVITVSIVEMDGSEVFTQMTEGAARVLLGTLGLPQPAVLCSQHEPMEVSTSLDTGESG